jgi:outer membrane protein OmpA-like peptidoglycan-associated protein
MRLSLAVASVTLALGTITARPLPAQARSTSDCVGTVYGQGRRAICLPQGAASFADSVVSFAPGARPSSGVWAEARHALGEPDYTRTSAPGFLSLGCDGVLIVRFDDNALVEVDGPDLYVFEIGPAVEATDLAVSVDGTTWLEVGRIEGAQTELELAGIIDADDVYRYVRLTNRSRTCGGRHSGADIDAVAAVGSALRVALDAAVLFEVGASTLKAEAQASITAAAALIRARRATRVLVEGHTDSDGDAAANQALSVARAASVRDALVAAGVDASILRTRGHGERRPVAPNDTPENKARNRRVDLLVR